MKQLFYLSITLVSLFILPATSGVNAQGVGINPSGNSPDPSAILDVGSTTSGMLIPRMTTAQRDAISSPALALQIFNITTNCFEFYTGTFWQAAICTCISAPVTPASITGPASACQGQSGLSYSIASVPTTTSYVWTVPSGASVTSGQGTNSITVAFGASSGNVNVSAINTCGASSAQELAIIVNALPVATFSYMGSPYCNNASNPTPTFSGGGVAGTFSLTTGLVFVNASTGQINLSACTPGTYTVTNTIAASGGCSAVTATSNITILATPPITCTSTATRNDAGTLTLGGVSSGTLNWYAAATGGSSLGTGYSFTTPSISSTTTFYVDATTNGCTSTPRIGVTATISSSKGFQVDNGGTLTTGLVSYWKLDGNSTDFYGSNNGTHVSVSYGTGFGKVNQGGNFNGSSYVSLGSYPTSGTGNFSIFSWVKTTVIGTRKNIVSYGTANAPSNTSTFLFINPSNQAEFDLALVTGPNSSVMVTDGNWHLIGVTNTGGTMQMYVDGSASGSSVAMNPNIGTGGGSFIGKDVTNGAYFSGFIDEVGIWSKALTAQEISNLWNVGAGQSMTTASSVITGITNVCAGATTQLSATIAGGTWSSSNTATATVNSGGLVTGGAGGTTTITYSVPNGSCVDIYSTIVTVSAIPTITGTTPSLRNGAGTVTLGATASAGTISWYTAATGGSPLATGTSFTTPNLCATTTYYVDATANGCTTASRTSVTATVNKTFSVDNGCTLTNNLFSYWKLDGNSTDFFSTNNGTDVSIAYGTSFGKINQGALFNGTSSQIGITSVNTGIGSFSIAAWVKTTDSNSSDKEIVSFGNNATNQEAELFKSGTKLRACFYGAGGNIVSSADINDGNWHLCIVTFNGTNLTLYLDNISQGSGPSVSVNIGSNHGFIGFALFSSATVWNGDIDEVGIWTKVLSVQEITDLWNGGAGQAMH